MKLIGIEDITVRFDNKTILDHVSLCVDKGDFMAITGPNGGGKTTLLRVMLRLMKPSSGKVKYYHDGSPTKSLKIGYLPQKSNIDTRFPITAGETIKSGQIKGLFGRRTAKDEEDFRRVVELCGVGEYLDRTVGVLSGGQLQRTLLARALVSNPEVIVLDEPLSYVDKTFERQIYSMMEDLAKEHTIVLVSHEMSVISGMANRHIIVDRGIHECTSHHHSFT
ncbi:MAG: metal ABC transporter ATP-binding protein, partial [Muribaculaceae bacterium]|nr:metal ABC transporter ATP-binding protein [Muribaculaceae bacterium]